MPYNNRFETDSPIVMEFAFPAARGKLHANYGSPLKRLLCCIRREIGFGN
jgi:hypothetical protein